MSEHDNLGSQWLSDALGRLSYEVQFLTPVEFTERYRYLTSAMTPSPGLQEYSQYPFWIEPLNRLAPWDSAKEIYVMKGVQVGFNTSFLEPAIMYAMAQIKTAPSMLISNTDDAAKERWDVYILPSLLASGFEIIKSHDSKNPRKTGQTARKIEHLGGGVLYLLGSVNQNNMRSKPIRFLFMDEVSGWTKTGKQGDSVELIKARTNSFSAEKKIIGGSTPLLLPNDAIHAQFMRGDQRYYNIRCRSCSFQQILNMRQTHVDTKNAYGFHFEMENGHLVNESVRFICANCGHEHFEKDKTRLFSDGAEWVPTAEPHSENIYSYHLSGWYSPYGVRTWAENIQQYADCYDFEKKIVKNVQAYQTFYNNVLGKPFDAYQSGKVKFEQVSRQRRDYSRGTIPSKLSVEACGDDIMYLTCGVDVQKAFLAAAVMGVTSNNRVFLVDYHRFERDLPDQDCADRSNPVWGKLAKLLMNKVYVSPTWEYRIACTFIDANGTSYDTVCGFCTQYLSGVYPIVGRGDNSGMTGHLSPFKTKWGTSGVKIYVNSYKMRLLTSLRRFWVPESGPQEANTVNLPVDLTHEELMELTKEEIREDKRKTGHDRFVFHRTGDNELIDTLVYASAASDFLALQVNETVLKQDPLNWELWWKFARSDKNDHIFARKRPANPL